MVKNIDEKLFENLVHKILLLSKGEFYMAKIHKLIYFLEFNYLERNEKELLREVFIKNHFGPTSINLKKILDKLISKGLITSQEDDKGREVYFSITDKEYNFNDKINVELEYLKKKYFVLSTKKIAELSHEDNPFKVTDDQQVIDKHSVFFRTADFSVFN